MACIRLSTAYFPSLRRATPTAISKAAPTSARYVSRRDDGERVRRCLALGRGNDSVGQASLPADMFTAQEDFRTISLVPLLMPARPIVNEGQTVETPALLAPETTSKIESGELPVWINASLALLSSSLATLPKRRNSLLVLPKFSHRNRFTSRFDQP